VTDEATENTGASAAAPPLVGEFDPDAIRKELLEAGRSQWHSRWSWYFNMTVVVPCLVFAVYDQGFRFSTVLMYFAIAQLALSSPLISLYFNRKARRRLRSQLASLSPDQQVAVLAPLREHRRNDAWRFVQPVLWGLDLPTELTPAAPLPRAGNEPVPPVAPDQPTGSLRRGVRLDARPR
jgi:hypothetical protein